MAEELNAIVGPNGQTVLVDDGRARINPRTDFEQALLDGRAFSWAALNKDADAAHDTILGLENNSPTDVLKIHKLIVSHDAASQIQVFTASAITMAGTTAVVGQNLNRASGRVAQATAYTDETGNTEQGSSYPSLVFRDTVVADVVKEILIDGAIVLAENQMVGVDFTTAGTTFANATFIGWFEPR